MGILEMKQVSYHYQTDCDVLKDLNFTFEKGKIYAIVGKSGAGKTTLLSLLSKLTSPSEGEILFNGTSLQDIDSYHYRSHDVGVIFQSFNLLPNLSAQENVELSIEISNHITDGLHEQALRLLKQVGLHDDEAKRRVLKLSGGQQQRVAIARALSFDPKILLADEPTGNLDETTQNEILEIFKKLAYEEEKCVIIVTHATQVAKMADEIFVLEPRNS